MSDPSINVMAERGRAAIMGLLARSTPEELSAPLAAYWPTVTARVFRAPETGLVMLRGRICGDGAPFNFGEATVSRAVVELDTGERGYGQLLGRNRRHARDAAVVEALAQRAQDAEKVEALILEPIARRIAEEARRQRAETAATKVDFFTLVRAEG